MTKEDPDELGIWGDVIRELGEWQPQRYSAVARWPLAEAMRCFRHKVKDEALKRYKFEFMVWAVLAQSGATKNKAPKLPEILKD